MGRRGPAPRPAQLKLLHGERKDRINLAEPRPRQLPPARPPWLTEAAAAEWDRVMPDLEAMGTVTAADATAVAAYCEAAALLGALAGRMAADGGPAPEDVDGAVVRHPAFTAWRAASGEVRAWCRELGLTPAARQPLRVEHVHRELPAERLLS